MVDFDMQNRTVGFQNNMGKSTPFYDIESEKQRIALGTEEIKKEIADRFKKKYANAQIFPAVVALMHPEVRDFLLNFNLVYVYDGIAKQANLDSAGRNILPKIVWEIAQSEKWGELDEILESHLQLTHSVHVQVANLLKQEILNKIQVLSEKPVLKKVIEEEVVSKKTKLFLADAISKYPKIFEQNITSDQIRIRTMPDLVRPSIKNWITDFQDVMGAKKHSPIDRGNYLFHSDNTKKLTVADRQKLGTILKSLDEETLLTVDVEAEKIVFVDTEETRNLNRTNTEKQQTTDNRQQTTISNSSTPSRGVYVDEVGVRNSNVISGLDSGSVVRNDNNGERNFANTEKVREIIRQPFIKEAPANFPVAKEFSQSEKTDFKHEERAESFFQIPGSKPPIGTQDYFADDLPRVDEVKKEEVKVQQPAQKMPSISKPQPQNISDVQVGAPKVFAATPSRDLETASDDELFEAMKQKKPVQKPLANQNYSNRFRIGHVDNSGDLNFSSPQQLPVEQKTQVAQSLVPKIASQISPQTAVQPERKSLHILQRGNETNKDVAKNPRINKNIVDLS